MSNVPSSLMLPVAPYPIVAEVSAAGSKRTMRIPAFGIEPFLNTTLPRTCATCLPFPHPVVEAHQEVTPNIAITR
jgi:hypothetical protein